MEVNIRPHKDSEGVFVYLFVYVCVTFTCPAVFYFDEVIADLALLI